MMRALFALLLALAVGLSACGDASPPPAPVAVAEKMPPEQMFVTVALGKRAEINDPTVARARELIERASSSFEMDRTAVADQAYMAFKIAKKDGISATAMEVLEAATLAHVPGAKMTFAEYCAMYLTLRMSGTAHAESMMGMKGIISRLNDLSK